VSGASGYKWSITNDYNLATEMGTATRRTETGLVYNTAYARYVWAYNDCGNSTPVTLTESTLEWICGDPIIDSRDGKTYTTIQIGTQCWMSQNLNIGTKVNGSAEQTNNSIIEKYCYNDLESNSDIYGGLYQWAEMVQYQNGATNYLSWNPVPTGNVVGICPTGWHLPSDAEWTVLATSLGGTAIAGGKMKETGTSHWLTPNTGATNSSGFTGLPSGVRNTSTSHFEKMGEYSPFYSSTESSHNNMYIFYLYSATENMTYAWHLKTNGLPVRCLNDAQLSSVTTTNATNILYTTATSGGDVTSDGGFSITARGVCWSTSPNPVITGSHTLDGSGTGPFASSLTGLTPNTFYYMRAYATNNIGTAYGNEVSFTSLPLVIPTVTTTVVTNNGQFSASSGGDVTFDGGAIVTARGVCWSASSAPNTTGSHTTDGSGTGTFVSSLTGLTEGTLYYVRAYATNSIGTAYGNEYSFTTSVSDIDGNIYKTVRIGSQIWMSENLKTTKFKDGITSIPNVTESGTWAALSTSAYCWYNNEEATYKANYGALYNWYTVSTGNLCPTGWHVPTDAELTTLTTYLGGESVSGGKLKETGTTHWTTPNTGATNETGFTALPGGSRHYGGSFNTIGNYGLWWSSTEYPTSDAWFISMSYNNNYVSRTFNYRRSGYSVRCLKD
jgi:uncharacterized protein (TIGR02145 family)